MNDSFEQRRGLLADALAAKFRGRKATVAVVGLGYVGLPLLARFHDVGYQVIGFDIDGGKIESLKRGENYLPHLGADLCTTFAKSERFSGTTDARGLAGADAVVICVPTPLGQHNEPDLKYVTQTGRMLGEVGIGGKLIVLESTSFPGTTREILVPAMLGAGEPKDAYLVAFSPEREDPGNMVHSTKTIPKLVGGLDVHGTRAGVALYQGAVDRVIEVGSAEVAEAAKVFENVFRAVNIALVNELKMILDPMRIDVWEVIEAARSKPFGFMPFYPGPGLGGHCIPIDPYYLAWKAREFKTAARFIELAGEINTSMPGWVVGKVVGALNDRAKSVRNAKIMVLGLAYKPDISDVRESPSFELIERLEHLGAKVCYSDPHVPKTWEMRKHDLQMHSTVINAQTITEQDCVLISTHHQAFEYGLIAQHARLVVDTRNAMAPFAVTMGERLVRA